MAAEKKLDATQEAIIKVVGSFRARLLESTTTEYTPVQATYIAVHMTDIYFKIKAGEKK